MKPDGLFVFKSIWQQNNILADTCYEGSDPMAVIILNHQKFLVENIPTYQTIHFLYL